MNLREWAAFYARLGLRTTPVHPPCAACRRAPTAAPSCTTCRGGKKPVLADWKSGGTLREGYNIGVVTGAASGGVVVSDFDTKPDFRRVLRAAPEEVAHKTLVAETCRGYHVYARAPGFGRSRHVDGILVRGEGGQVVAPPSVHATDFQYAFLPGRALDALCIAPAEEVLPATFLRTFLAPSSNTPTPPRAPRAAAGGAALDPVDLAEVEERIRRRGAAVVRHWMILRGEAPPLPREEGGRSRSDWVAALCLAELGYAAGQIAWALSQLPGSKAAERGVDYALLTAQKAAELRSGVVSPPERDQSASQVSTWFPD